MCSYVKEIGMILITLISIYVAYPIGNTIYEASDENKAREDSVQ